MRKNKKIGIISHIIDFDKAVEEESFILDKMEKRVICLIDEYPEKEKIKRDICNRLEVI